MPTLPHSGSVEHLTKAGSNPAPSNRCARLRSAWDVSAGLGACRVSSVVGQPVVPVESGGGLPEGWREMTKNQRFGLAFALYGFLMILIALTQGTIGVVLLLVMAIGTIAFVLGLIRFVSED